MKAETLALEADILVLGGGLAGCNAAIGAAEAGARVVLFDKARVKYSGDGGLGIDDHTLRPPWRQTFLERCLFTIREHI